MHQYELTVFNVFVCVCVFICVCVCLGSWRLHDKAKGVKCKQAMTPGLKNYILQASFLYFFQLFCKF